MSDQRFTGSVLTPHGEVGFYSESELARDFVWETVGERLRSAATAAPNHSGHRKPPVGLVPHSVWKYKRILEIMRAIVRYEDAGIEPPYEWHTELQQLIDERCKPQ